MTDEPALLTAVDGAILIATLNRPTKLNAINREMMDLLIEAVYRFRDDPALKVMLIRATGRYFSAGADLKASGNSDEWDYTRSSAVREMHRLKMNGMQPLYNEMEAIEKPFVVAHHARCVGGGLEISLSCDFRLAAKSASYSFPEGLFGVLPASNGVSRLTRIVGTHWARYLVMANLIVDADRAYNMGLVHEVYPDEGFDESVMAFCRHIAQQNGEQMGAAKLAIELCRDLELAQARNIERLTNSALMIAPGYQAGMDRHRDNVGKGMGQK
jgi:enoyl-CoA hydratase